MTNVSETITIRVTPEMKKWIESKEEGAKYLRKLLDEEAAKEAHIEPSRWDDTVVGVLEWTLDVLQRTPLEFAYDKAIPKLKLCIHLFKLGYSPDDNIVELTKKYCDDEVEFGSLTEMLHRIPKKEDKL